MPFFLGNGVEETDGTAVEVVRGEKVVAGGEGLQKTLDRRHARRKGEGRAAVLQQGQGLFELFPRRILRADVIIARAPAHARVGVGRGRVNGRDDAARRVGFISPVNAKSGKVHAEFLPYILAKQYVCSLQNTCFASPCQEKAEEIPEPAVPGRMGTDKLQQLKRFGIIRY